MCLGGEGLEIGLSHNSVVYHFDAQSLAAYIEHDTNKQGRYSDRTSRLRIFESAVGSPPCGVCLAQDNPSIYLWAAERHPKRSPSQSGNNGAHEQRPNARFKRRRSEKKKKHLQ